MNFDNFTIKSQEVVQQAVQTAQQNGNQAIEPEHLLKALLDKGESVVKFVFQKLGVNQQLVAMQLDKALSALPKVSGGEPYLSRESNDVLLKAIDCAKRLDVYLSFGYSERDAQTATLYNSNMLISPQGQALNHRKLKPTGAERLVWGDAQCDFFPVMDTPWGKIGSLICWESYMPLARAALYEKGITIYISPNTNDNPEWQHTIRHIAIESHCYFINADLFFRCSDYPETSSGADEIARLQGIACRGGSCVIDPFGHDASETVWDEEAIIYADLDMQKVPASRMEFDGCGHYARPDVLQLNVKE